MKKLFPLILLVLIAGRLGAQTIAKNEPSAHENILFEPTPAPSAPELPSYHVSITQSKSGISFNIISPKSEKAELKLLNSAGGDVCFIHKGSIREGKNTYTLHNPKITPGMYYVVSKFSTGEQFADKVVIPGKQ